MTIPSSPVNLRQLSLVLTLAINQPYRCSAHKAHPRRNQEVDVSSDFLNATNHTWVSPALRPTYELGGFKI